MLSFDGLDVRFGDVVALDDLSFDVPAGEVFGFLGPNGAGKTTAMRAIFGIVVPRAGRVLWRGSAISAVERLSFGYMPEERGLYPSMRVLDQLVYFGRLHGLTPHDAAERGRHWLGLLDLGDREEARVDSLSLGNQQRVQLATALLHEPELLVLDEPFSGLDPVGIDALAAVLRERAEGGATVVFSSHQLDLVEGLCDSVAVIARGRTVLSGSVEQLTTEGSTLVVGVSGAPGWADLLPGVDVLGVDGDRVRLRLRGADPGDVLAAALAAGQLTHYGTERRRLSELFREAVAR